MAFQEYDLFALAKPIPGEEIPVGTPGVVLMVFDSEPPAYEVEFCDEHGNNLGSATSYTLTSAFMSKEARLEHPHAIADVGNGKD